MPPPKSKPKAPQRYPTAHDYDTAVRRPDLFVLDPVLKRGKARFFKGEPLMYSGGFARVFRFDVGGKQYALRCWIADTGESVDIYREAHAYIKPKRSPHFLDFEFVEKGIIAMGKPFPTVRMDWVEGPSLKEFVQKNLNQQPTMSRLREQFVSLCRHLHDNQVAHGDLQPDNVKVRNGGSRLDIVLIDYDTLVVPRLQGLESRNAGLPGFQHPARAHYNRTGLFVDYFSELVIYISLLAFERYPQLWYDFDVEGRDKDLLFNSDDFVQPDRSPCLKALLRTDDEMKDLVKHLTSYCKTDSIEKLQPLEWALNRVRTANGGSFTPGISSSNPASSQASVPQPPATFSDLLKQKMNGPSQPAPVPNAAPSMTPFQRKLAGLNQAPDATSAGPGPAGPGAKRKRPGQFLSGVKAAMQPGAAATPPVIPPPIRGTIPPAAAPGTTPIVIIPPSGTVPAGGEKAQNGGLVAGFLTCTFVTWLICCALNPAFSGGEVAAVGAGLFVFFGLVFLVISAGLAERRKKKP